MLAEVGRQAAPARKERIRILCVDGGGIRGIVPTVTLTALQERLERPVVEYFDVIAGTSTGGLLAAGLCVPDRQGEPRYTLQEILGFYTEDCHRIFHRNLGWKLASLWGLWRPKYTGKGIEGFLADRFGEMELKDALKPLVLMSYSISAREPWFFSSRLAAVDPARNFLVRHACRATTAAPTFFPAAIVPSLAGVQHELIDGGVCANDPVLGAFAEAENLHPDARLQVLSLGTGNVTRPINARLAKNWGAGDWALRILDVLSDGQSRMSETCVGRLVRRSHRDGADYWRLQPRLPPDLGHMDDTRPEHLAGLQQATRAYCDEFSEKLDAIAAALSA